MATRSEESLLHEADYWLLMLEDLLAINDLTVEASRPLADIPIRVLSIVAGGDVANTGELINASANASLDALVRMGDPIARLLELVKGREAAMRNEHDEC